jgi:hypothetical protein
MSDKKVIGPHWSFWVIGAIALLWNLLGSLNYVMQMNSDVVAAMPETHRAIIASRPGWATGAFALAVFGGAAACLLLLLRKSASFYLFVASLLGTATTMLHTAGIAKSTSGFGPFEIMMMIVMPLVAGAFLIWYSKLAERKGWIN